MANVTDVLKGQTIDNRYENVYERLVTFSIELFNAGIAQRAEGKSFEELQKIGLLKDGVTEDAFNQCYEASKPKPGSVSDESARELVTSLVDNDLLKQSSDYISEDDVNTFKEQLEEYVTATTEYQQAYYTALQEHRSDMRTYMAELEASYRELSQQIENSNHGTIFRDTATEPPRPEFQAPPHPTVKPAPNIFAEIFNKDISDGEVTLIIANPKDKSRALEKLGANTGGDSNIESLEDRSTESLTDIIRAKILATKPVYADAMARYLTDNREKNEYQDRGAEFRDSGLFYRPIKLQVENDVAEIIIEDQGQYEMEKISHELFERIRTMTTKDRKQFNESHLTKYDLEKVRTTYNKTLEEIQADHPIAKRLFKAGEDFADVDFSRAKELKEFCKGGNLEARYNEMLRMHQALHLSAAIHSIEVGQAEWAEEYLRHAVHYNEIVSKHVQPNQPPPRLIPEEMLDELADVLHHEITGKTPPAGSVAAPTHLGTVSPDNKRDGGEHER